MPATKKKLLMPDAKGRITIGRMEGVVGYSVTHERDGKIVLVPMAAIPAAELWLHENKSGLAKVERGIQQSKAGERARWGSFARHAKGDQ